jgi:hypothetical protein
MGSGWMPECRVQTKKPREKMRLCVRQHKNSRCKASLLSIFFIAKILYWKKLKKIAKPGGLGLDGTFLNRELFCAAHLITCVTVGLWAVKC